MMEKFSVDIVCYNDMKDSFKTETFYCKSMFEVARVLITYKGIKNYYIVNVNISRVESLV